MDGIADSLREREDTAPRTGSACRGRRAGGASLHLLPAASSRFFFTAGSHGGVLHWPAGVATEQLSGDQRASTCIRQSHRYTLHWLPALLASSTSEATSWSVPCATTSARTPPPMLVATPCFVSADASAVRAGHVRADLHRIGGVAIAHVVLRVHARAMQRACTRRRRQRGHSHSPSHELRFRMRCVVALSRCRDLRDHMPGLISAPITGRAKRRTVNHILLSPIRCTRVPFLLYFLGSSSFHYRSTGSSSSAS